MKIILFFLLSCCFFLKSYCKDVPFFGEEKNQQQEKDEASSLPFSSHFNSTYFQRGWVGLFMALEGLYWKGKFDGDEYAYQVIRKAIKLGVLDREKTKQANFDWDFGIRGKVGLVFPSSGWKFIGSGSWYKSDQDVQGNGTSTSVLIPFLEILFGLLKEESSHASISYKEFLIELKKPFLSSRLLAIETAMGVKKCFVTQNQKVEFYIPSFLNKEKGSLVIKDRSCFEAMGPLLQLETKLPLFLGLNILGEIGGALLFADFEVNHSEKNLLLQGIDLHAKTHLFASLLDIGLGLGWDFYSLHYHLNLTLAYEAHYIWPQKKKVAMEGLIKNRELPFRGHFEWLYSECDLLLYGLTLRMSLEF